MDGGSLTRSKVVDSEAFFQQYDAMKEDYESLRKRYADLIATHSGTAHKLELAQGEISRVKKLYEEAVQETSNAIRERNGLQQQCAAAISQWNSALMERNEYKEALTKVQQRHEEAMKEINQAMAVRLKSNKEIKRLNEERDAAVHEYRLIMSERDQVHTELEKLTDDLAQSKKEIKRLEAQNKELMEKIQEALQESEVSKRRRDWAFNERDKIVRERESLRTLCDRLRKERDRAVSDLAEALSESEDIRKQKNLASKQLKELRDKIEIEKENRSMRFQYLSNSSFSESRDSAIDSDMHSGHYSIKLPNSRGGQDHGLVFEPGVYISRIVPGSPAAKEMNLSVGDRVLFINDTQIDNVQDALLALSEDIDPVVLTLSRSAGHLSSPINCNTNPNSSNSGKPMASSGGNHGGTPKNFHNSNSSLKSDKSEPSQQVITRRGGASSGGKSGISPNSGGSGSGGGGLRDIFRVRLPGKKYSSPEEATLATLDSAIAAGGAGGSPVSGSTSHNRKIRKKRDRSNRNSSGENPLNKNGTWPRMMLPRNSNSYTLPQGDQAELAGSGNASGTNTLGPSSNISMGGGGGHHGREISFHGQYTPHASNTPLVTNPSSSYCIRRPQGGKERAPISNMVWDLTGSHPAKSLGAIGMSGGGGLMSGGSGGIKSLTLAGPGRSGITSLASGGGLDLGNHGLPLPSSASQMMPPHHRYSFGMFEPPSSGSKMGKGPERNSVVPTLTMSDGSSIDFSVKSGNMEILEYYVKRMVKNQNNSSESDNIDKVVTPPSLAIHNVPVGSSPASSLLTHSAPSPVTVTATLDRYRNQYRYSGHHHPVLPGSNAGTLPLSIPKSDNSFAFEPYHQHSHPTHHVSTSADSNNSLSVGSGGSSRGFRNSDDLLLHPSFPHMEQSGTFPRKREVQRIRIPSNQSVTSRSSTEKFDMRNSPMPSITIDVKFVDENKGRIEQPPNSNPRKPLPGQFREINIQKNDSAEPLGINIAGSPNGLGVFVSSVSANSLAAQCGLQVGDQILDYCGINFRTATYELAQNFMARCCKDSVSLLVQYCPDKFLGKSRDNGSSSDDSHSDRDSCSDHDDNHSSMSDNESRSGSRSGSPTPCNSPQSTLVRKKHDSIQRGGGGGVVRNYSQDTSNDGNTNSLTKKGGHHSQPQGVIGLPTLQQQQQMQQQQSYSMVGSSSDRDPPSEQSTLRSTRSSGGGSMVQDGGEGKMLLQEKTRFLTLNLQKNSSNLGVCLVGGNVVGIYVHSVQPESIADRAGLRTGDQILEYNGTDLRHATAEEAAFELAKPLDKVGVLVQYNLQRYNEVKDKPGDGFYIRALFDYPPISENQHGQSGSLDHQQLTFHKDEILYVDNTMYNGKPGRWRAWTVDAEGRQQRWGIIPSKFKVEEDLLFKRSLGDLDGDRRSSTVTRRSFFRRKSHHRSSSRELASFSDFSINSYSDLSAQLGGLQLKDESASVTLSSYQRVERLDYMCFLRPVIILGALSDVIAERLALDFPFQFGRASVEVMNCSGPMLEQGLAENIFVDYKRKGSHYECLTLAAIKEISAKKLYCIIDVSTSGAERLQRAQMYPIVILVKFKSAKQIREIKDLRCDKITPKASKELYEHAQKIESEYKHLITACVPGGTNISYLATQVKVMVEQEQSKTLWLPI